jgi:hypothetical protein
MCVPNRTADLFGERNAAQDGSLSELANQNRKATASGDGAHLDSNWPGEPLRPDIVDRIDDCDVPVFVGNRERRGLMPVQGQRDEVHLRIGSSHRIAVDDRQPEFAADREGHH